MATGRRPSGTKKIVAIPGQRMLSMNDETARLQKAAGLGKRIVKTGGGGQKMGNTGIVPPTVRTGGRDAPRVAPKRGGNLGTARPRAGQRMK